MALVTRVPAIFWFCGVINFLLADAQATFYSFSSSSSSTSSTHSASYLLVNNIKFEFDNGFYKNDSCEFLGNWDSKNGISKEACLKACKDMPGCKTYKWHPKNAGFCLYTDRKYQLEEAMVFKSWTCGIRKTRVAPSPSPFISPTKSIFTPENLTRGENVQPAKIEQQAGTPQPPSSISNSELTIPLGTPSNSKTAKPSATPSASSSASVSSSETPSVSPSITPAISPSASPTPSSTASTSAIPSISVSSQPSTSSTPSVSPPESESPSETPSATPSASISVSASRTMGPSNSQSAEPSITPSESPIESHSASMTVTASVTATPVQTPTQSLPIFTMAVTVSVFSSPRPSMSSTANGSGSRSSESKKCYFANFDYWENTWGNTLARCVYDCKENFRCQSYVYRIEERICSLGQIKYRLEDAFPNERYYCGVMGSSEDSPTPSSSSSTSTSISVSASPTSSSSSAPSMSMTTTASMSPSTSSSSTSSASSSPSSSPSPTVSISRASSSTLSSINKATETSPSGVKFKMANGVYQSKNCFFPGFLFWKTLWGATWETCSASCKATAGCKTFVFRFIHDVCSMSDRKFKLTKAMSSDIYYCGALESSQQ